MRDLTLSHVRQSGSGKLMSQHNGAVYDIMLGVACKKMIPACHTFSLSAKWYTRDSAPDAHAACHNLALRRACDDLLG